MRTLLMATAAAALLVAGAALAQAVIPAQPTTIAGLTATVVSLQQQINVQKNQIADLQAKTVKQAQYASHTHNTTRAMTGVQGVNCTAAGACTPTGPTQVLTSFTVGTPK